MGCFDCAAGESASLSHVGAPIQNLVEVIQEMSLVVLAVYSLSVHITNPPAQISDVIACVSYKMYQGWNCGRSCR